jgi:hypothetical protein
MLRWSRRAAVAALAAFPAMIGCGHVPVTSLIKLAQIDFANTDPARLRAAIKLPRSVRPRPEGVALRLGVKIANGHEAFEDFVLREVSEPAEVLALHRELEPDTHIFAYRLDGAEVTRLNAFREALKKKQEATGGRGGALTIAIRPEACRTAELPSRAVYVSTFLKTAETGGFVPLTRDVDLRTIAGRDLAAALPPC